MSNSDLVRASRDGDYFHYLWAARRCLSLLSSQSGLVAVTIEGPYNARAAVDVNDLTAPTGPFRGIVGKQLKYQTVN